MANVATATELFTGARVLVAGAAGTVGHQLATQLSTFDVRELRLVDSNETELFFLADRYRSDQRVHAFLADVRSQERMHEVMRGIDYAFHAAALKHVILCERSPFDAVQTNILGVQHLITAAKAHQVKRVLFTSSDKAVNPTNVMGTSKLMGERLMTAANAVAQHEGDTKFASTRFGNVVGSRGSVIPVFVRQIEAGGPLTLTDPAMTRFVMTLPEAVRLVIESMAQMHGGEVFIPKMPALRIGDLAHEMIAVLAPRFGADAHTIAIEQIGARPGEKHYEELMNEEETRRSYELDGFFVVLPAFRNEYAHIKYEEVYHLGLPVREPYQSRTQTPMTPEQIRTYLLQPGVLQDALRASLLAQAPVVQASARG
jgi:FlaA1/EpsC-like NDP-sugar epimerase